MAFNPFRKKESVAAKEAGKTEEKKPAAVKTALARPKSERRVLGVIVAPHLTEKAMAGGHKGWYIFRVMPSATKIAVRRAVQDRYGVAVQDVRIINQPGKKIRLGRIEGRAASFKKAIVKLVAGQSIDIT